MLCIFPSSSSSSSSTLFFFYTYFLIWTFFFGFFCCFSPNISSSTASSLPSCSSTPLLLHLHLLLLPFLHHLLHPSYSDPPSSYCCLFISHFFWPSQLLSLPPCYLLPLISWNLSFFLCFLKRFLCFLSLLLLFLTHPPCVSSASPSLPSPPPHTFYSFSLSVRSPPVSSDSRWRFTSSGLCSLDETSFGFCSPADPAVLHAAVRQFLINSF